MTVRELVAEQISSSAASLELEERVVLDLLLEAARTSRKMTQRDIARAEPWRGCHPTHEIDIVRNIFETTTRQVRKIIRNLRVRRNIPVLSDDEGYYLPQTEEAVVEYLQRMEREAYSRSRSSVQTYLAMRNTLGTRSAVFDTMAEQMELPGD